MSPTIAARGKWARIEALMRKRDFLNEYRRAWLAFVANPDGVVFPAGTWAMRRFAPVADHGGEGGPGALDPAPE
jgi:hypothetical protein